MGPAMNALTSRPSARVLVIFVCVLFACLATLAWPVLPWQSARQTQVTITALGEKNPAAQGSEVWIVELPSQLPAAALLASRSSALGWEQRDGALLSSHEQPATIRHRGPVDQGAKLGFVRHPWSGKVEVAINGEAKVYDLYSPRPDTPLVVDFDDFPPGAEVSGPNLRFLAWVAGGTLALLALVAAGAVILPRLSPSSSRSSPPGETIIFGLPSLVVFAIVLAGTWPAQMSPDSVGQWTELHTGAMTNAHPWIHTWLWVGIGALLGSPGWSIVIQIVAISLAVGAFCAEIARWGISRTIVWLAAFMTPLWPANALLSTALWKDIPFSIAACVLTVLVLQALRTGGESFRGRSFTLGFAVSLFLVATLRHNGLIVAAGVALLMAVLYRRVITRRAVAALLAAGVVLPVAWSAVILPAAGVAGIGRH